MTHFNQSIGNDLEWVEDGLVYTELTRQEYSNCVFSAGSVEGHPVDTLYLKLERGGITDIFLLLRPDEAAAIAYLMSAVLWSDLVVKLPDGE